MKWFNYDRPLTQAPPPWYPDRVFPVALSLGGLLIRVVALAVLPRVTSALARAPKAELEIAVAPRVEETPAVEEPILKIRKVASPRWPLSLQITPGSPPLQARRSPTGARAPPFAGAGTRSRAYLHRRSYPINRVDPMGLDPSLWVGYGFGATLPRANNIVGSQEATPSNFEQALSSGYDVVMLNAHHYPGGKGIELHGGFVHVDEILKRIPKSKRPKVLILNGCNTQRSLPEGEVDKDITIIYSNAIMNGFSNTRMQSTLLPKLLSGESPADAIRETAEQTHDTYIREHVRVYGNQNPRL